MMKKTARMFTLLISAVLIALSAAGCKESPKEQSGSDDEPSVSNAASSAAVSETEASGKETSGQGKSLADEIMGFWTSEDDNGYVNIKLMLNGDAFMGSNLIEHGVMGKWSLSGNELTLTFDEKKIVCEYSGGNFVSKDSTVTFRKGTTSPSKWSGQTSTAENSVADEKDIAGTWSSSYNGDNILMQLSENGTARISNSNVTEDVFGKWVFIENKLTLFVNGEAGEFIYDGEKLASVNDEQMIYARETNTQTSEPSKYGYKTSDIYGQWAYVEGEKVVFMEFTDDGMVQITSNEMEGTTVGLWELNENKVTVNVKGNPKVYNYNGAFLIADENENELFYKT